LLADKDVVAREVEEQVRKRVGELGLELVSVGVRDVILPGEMKDLMNKVTEAKKAAEANLIVKDITVDGGRTLKRISPAPQGRAHRIRKRSNHVTIILDKK